MNTPDSQRSTPMGRLLRLSAVVIVILVFGIVGVHAGIRTAGLALLGFAALQLFRRFRSYGAQSCELSGQLPTTPAMLLAALQAGVGAALMARPDWVLWLLGVDPV